MLETLELCTNFKSTFWQLQVQRNTKKDFCSGKKFCWIKKLPKFLVMKIHGYKLHLSIQTVDCFLLLNPFKSCLPHTHWCYLFTSRNATSPHNKCKVYTAIAQKHLAKSFWFQFIICSHAAYSKNNWSYIPICESVLKIRAQAFVFHIMYWLLASTGVFCMKVFPQTVLCHIRKILYSGLIESRTVFHGYFTHEDCLRQG